MLSVRLHCLMSFRDCLCRSYVTQCDLLHYFRMSQLINLEDIILPILGLLQQFQAAASHNENWTSALYCFISQRNTVNHKQTPRPIQDYNTDSYNGSTKSMRSIGIQSHFVDNEFIIRDLGYRNFYNIVCFVATGRYFWGNPQI